MRIVDSKQMQAMDRHTIENIGVPGIVLMENAARAWVEVAEPMIKEARNTLIFCGAGNNGGDGYAIARNLASRHHRCIVVAAKPPKSPDCIKNAEIWAHYGKTVTWENFLSNNSLNSQDVVVDSILGTGIESTIKGELLDVIKIINSLPGKKISVDIPSGISASTGDTLGAAIRSDLCITFQKEKVGHHLYPGKLFAGKVVCQNISIQEVFEKPGREYHLIEASILRPLLRDRKPDSYKNLLGHLLTWCGKPGTLGASLLASYAALKTGTGLTTAALPKKEKNAFLGFAPELMSCNQEKLTANDLQNYDALVVGCGLGRDRKIWKSVVELINISQIPTVLDADAFYGISDIKNLNPQKLVLTPHPGEFSALSRCDKPKTNAERIRQGEAFVADFPATLILKGAPSIIVTTDGKICINSTGNSGMATAGSGDVLAGMVGGFLAQGMPPDQAALLGTWLHGKSGDLYRETHCEESLTATNLIEHIDPAIQCLYHGVD